MSSDAYLAQADIKYLIGALEKLEQEIATQPNFKRLVDDIVSRRNLKLKLIAPSGFKPDNSEVLIRRRQYFSKEPEVLTEITSFGRVEYIEGKKNYEIVVEMPPTIHGAGAGRSEKALMNLLQRLGHLGFDASKIGSDMARPVKAGDLVFGFSGSWTTLSTITYAKEAKKLGATVVGITSYPDRAGPDCTYTFEIGGRESMGEKRDYYLDQLRGKAITEIDPMGTIYEFKAGVFSDIVIHYVRDRLEEQEETMRKRHVRFE